MDDLPDCMLLEILIRLPLKSIFQCKCVSHRWRSLISAPSFAYLVRLQASSIFRPPIVLLFNNQIRNRNSIKKFLVAPEESPEFDSLVSLIIQCNNNDSAEDTVHASCHDLLLCSKKMDAGSDSMTAYYMLNPITRQSVALPPLLQSSRRTWVGFVCYYNDNINMVSYRVLRIPYFPGKYIFEFPKEFKVDIFSSDTGRWSESVVLWPKGYLLNEYVFAGVPYNGLLFWLGKDGCVFGVDPCTGRCCRFFQSPIESEEGLALYHLEVCQGALRMFEVSGLPLTVTEQRQSKLRVWELKDYDNEGGEWWMEHELCFHQMVSEKSAWLTDYVRRGRNSPILVAMLACHPYDRDIVYVMIRGKIISCNMRRKTLEVLCDHPYAEARPDFYNGLTVCNLELSCWPTLIPSSPFLTE